MNKLSRFQKILFSCLLLFLFFFFIYGFVIGENSAGGGGYNGDFKTTFENLQLFVNNNFLEAIRLTTDNNLYYTNRPPLLYILHSLLNPFSNNKELYRLSVFFISLLVPLFFYLSLRIKFKKVHNIFLLSLSFLILLSPYFRTSSYWGLEENYAFITLFLSFIFLKKFFLKNNYYYLFFTVFLSSTCVYFDQKFIIIPLICFFVLIFSNILLKYKVFLTLLYLLLSIPFIYLIGIWGNITPVGNMDIYKVGKKFHPQHICYMVNILAFYMLPFLFYFEKNKIKIFFESIFKKKINYLLLIISFLYLIFFIFFLDITPSYKYGGGYSYKIAIFLSSSVFYQKIFLSLIFIFSLFILLFFINDNLINALFILFFSLSSVTINPLLHEYLDPIIFVLFFTFSQSKINLNIKNIFFNFFYFLIILLIARAYYIKDI
jgi:hypothetical protein